MRTYNWSEHCYFRKGPSFRSFEWRLDLDECSAAKYGLEQFFPHQYYSSVFTQEKAELQDNDKEDEVNNPELSLTKADYLLARRILVNRFLTKLRLLYKDLLTQYYFNFQSQSVILAYDYMSPSEIRNLKALSTSTCNVSDIPIDELEHTENGRKIPACEVVVKLIDYERIRESNPPKSVEEQEAILYGLNNLIKYLEELQ